MFDARHAWYIIHYQIYTTIVIAMDAAVGPVNIIHVSLWKVCIYSKLLLAIYIRS